MTGKHSPKRRGTASRPSAGRSWFWPLLGISIIVAFFVGLHQLANYGQPERDTMTRDSRPTAGDQQPSVTTAPSYEFYHLLPENEVGKTPAVPVPTPSPDRKVVETPSKKNAATGQFLLQTGAFRDVEAAERQRALLGFQGLKTRINQSTSDDGSTWYRVVTGPFESREEMEQVQKKLTASHLDPLVKQIP